MYGRGFRSLEGSLRSYVKGIMQEKLSQLKDAVNISEIDITSVETLSMLFDLIILPRFLLFWIKTDNTFMSRPLYLFFFFRKVAKP